MADEPIVCPTVMALCSGCGYREQDPETGLCEPCHKMHLQQIYAAKEALEADCRRRSWHNETMVLRQRRKRQRERLRPRSEPPPGADPWRIAEETLLELRKLEPACNGSWPMREAFLAVEEGLKQLAWGFEVERTG